MKEYLIASVTEYDVNYTVVKKKFIAVAAIISPTFMNSISYLSLQLIKIIGVQEFYIS